jgi:hypothetical protein
MAKYVIDSHALIWFLSDSKLLGPEAKKRLKDPNSEFYVLTDVLEEIRRKFEKFKVDNKDKGAIKIPPIICWLILKRSRNVKIRKLSYGELGLLRSKDPALNRLNKDDRPFVAKYFILKQKYPRTEVEIITHDDNLRKTEIIRTCW